MNQLKIWIAAALSVSLYSISQAVAACNPPGPEMTEKRLSRFIRDPAGILVEPALSNSSAAALSIQVSQLAVTGSEATDALKNTINQATAAQNQAIGRGFYLAFDYCQSANPNTAMRVDKAAGSLTNKDVLNSYVKAKLSTSVGSSSDASRTGYDSTASASRLSAGRLVREPSPSGAGSLNLTDPFGSPDDWK